MPVIEYMMHRNEQGKKVVPGFAQDGGHWHNRADNTHLGWLDSDRDYFVPDTIETKTKQECADRLIGIHSNRPFLTADSADPIVMHNMDSADVITMSNTWYDNIVLKHQG